MPVMKVVFLFLGALALGAAAPLDEDFGYVDVRPGAHMFWVLYHVDQPGDWTDYPLFLWLDGGPGASGVGYGNFQEMGPYYINGSLREFAWTKQANVMFVDNPVGSGYSYVDSLDLLTSSNQEIAADMMVFLKSVFADYPELSIMPFFIFGESYGGKMSIDVSLALYQAIADGEIDVDFRGIAIGDGYVSAMDYVNTWGAYLYATGYVNEQSRDVIDAEAAVCQQLADAGEWQACTECWGNAQNVVQAETGGVDFYNILVKEEIYIEKFRPHSRDLSYMSPMIRSLYKRHVEGFQTRDALDDFMNGEQADHWNIPADVTWGGQSGYVFNQLSGEFMQPIVDSLVVILETTDLFVNIYTGDLDLLADPIGAYRWIENMVWSGKADFDSTRRRSFHVASYSNAAGFVQQSGRLAVFTVLRAGHMVPMDASEEAAAMVSQITAFANITREAGKAKVAQKRIRVELKKPRNFEKSTSFQQGVLTAEDTNKPGLKEHVKKSS